MASVPPRPDSISWAHLTVFDPVVPSVHGLMIIEVDGTANSYR